MNKPKFKLGETVWFHPEPTLHPKVREKRVILEVFVSPYGVAYRTLKPDKFLVYNFENQFEKLTEQEK